MAKFELTYNGAKYEVDAPDEASALSAFNEQIVGSVPSADQRYTDALEKVRQTQFSGMAPESFDQYSNIAFGTGVNAQADQSKTLGFGDEISSGIGAFGSQVRNWLGDQSAPGFGEAYGDLYALEQARLDLAREQNGALGTGVEIAAGLATGGPARTGVAQALNAVQPTRLQSVLSGAASGGILGGLYGFGSGDEDRVASTLIGGGTGLAAGAAAPYIVDAGSSLYRTGRNFFSDRAAAQAMGMSPESANILRALTGADQTFTPQGQAGMQAAGNEAMLIDAGPNARLAADYLMRKPGQAGGIISDALGERANRASGDLDNALNVYLGDPQGVATMRRNIATSSAPDRQAAYNAAYAAPIDYSSEAGRSIEGLMGRVPQSAINAANNLMRTEGSTARQIMAQVADDGNVRFVEMPTVEQIDYITRGLNTVAKGTEGTGALGGMTDVGRAYSNLSRELRDATKIAAPAYETALETAATPIRQSQATQLGYDILSPNVPRDVAAQQVAGMSGPEREAVALGIRSKIDDTLANVRRVVSTGQELETRQAVRAMQDLTSPASRQKVSLAIGQQDADLLFDEVDRVFQSLYQESLRRTGSQTAGRLFVDEAFSPYTNPQDLLTTAGQGKPLQAGQRVIQALTGMGPEAMAGRADQIGSQVARALVSQGPELAGNVAGLQRLNAARNDTDALTRLIASRLRPAGTALAYPASMQSTRNR